MKPINPFLLISGIGMILVGAIPIIYWWKKKNVSIKYFALGALLWSVAIAAKILTAITLTPFVPALPIILGIYVGLRTGIFESGFTYLAALKTKLKEIKPDHAIAFALGFGGVEAILLGISSFLTVLLFLLMPDMLTQIPEAQREAIVQQLNQSSLVIPAPIIERISALAIHLFSTILVFLSIRQSRFSLLIASILYKTVADAPIPIFRAYIDMQTLQAVYLIETFYVGLAIVGIAGLRWSLGKWRQVENAKGNHHS